MSELLATHEAAAEAEADGRYSPEPLSARQVDASQAVDAESDAAALQAARRRARSASRLAASKAGPAAAAGPTGPADGAAAEGEGEGDGRLVQAEARKGMEAGEARFSVEVAVEGKVLQPRAHAPALHLSSSSAACTHTPPLPSKAEWWHDKYRPRKPKCGAGGSVCRAVRRTSMSVLPASRLPFLELAATSEISAGVTDGDQRTFTSHMLREVNGSPYSTNCSGRRASACHSRTRVSAL